MRWEKKNWFGKKDFIAIQRIQTILASYNALKTKINAIRLDAARIENGPNVHPISGGFAHQRVCNQTSAVIGQYADMQNELVEIVNINGLQLQLAVFETDVQKLESWTSGAFRNIRQHSKSLGATLVTVGKTINPDTKVIDCIARIDRASDVQLVNQSFVDAAVIVNK